MTARTAYDLPADPLAAFRAVAASIQRATDGVTDGFRRMAPTLERLGAWRGAMLGAPIVETPLLPPRRFAVSRDDGRTVVLQGVGSEHQREARRIVREGLADVLEWLGQPVDPAKADRWELTHGGLRG